ncbi:MAG: DMT family transporter [Coxiellaceae bacterium]|nr:DMT family transporter [Coxiellaceae bacterium]
MLAYLAIICTTILWASAFVLIKPLVTIMPASNLAILRYGLAALIIVLLYGLYPNKSVASLKIKLYAFAIGFIGIGIYNLTLNHAEITITAATTAFIICGIGPCISVALSLLFGYEKPTLAMGLGMLLCVSGLIFMTIHHWGFSSLWGLGYALIAAFCGGAFSVLQKPALKHLKPFEVMTFAICGGLLFSVFFAQHLMQTITTLSTNSWLQVLYLAIFPAIMAYSLWGYGIKRIDISKAVSVLYLLPVIAAVMAWFLDHAAPPVYDWIGGAVILCGAVLINNKTLFARRQHAMEKLRQAT